MGRWWWGISWGVLACAPSVEPSAAGTTSSGEATSSDGSSGTSTSTSTSTTSTTTTTIDPDSTSGGEDDADLCLQWCLSAEARACGDAYLGETCYSRCLDSLMYAIEDGCLDEQRDILACEGLAQGPAEPGCEALECEEVYIHHDLCRGSCSHLGGNQGAGGSQTDCDWRGTSCYGHELEVVCPLEDAEALCDCFVDGDVVAQCEVGEALEAFDCGGDDMHIFTSCCRETFEGVLLP